MIARSTLLALSLGMFSVAPVSSSYLPPQLLPVHGGADGEAFTRSCGAGNVLTGLRFRDGLLVDAVGILCRPIVSSATTAGSAAPASKAVATVTTWSLGPESTVGSLVGGSGGTSGTVSCGSKRVVTGAHIKHGTYVNLIVLYCRVFDASARTFGGDTQISEAAGSLLSGGAGGAEYCQSSTQPGSGIRGRAHSLVDAIGFICNEP